MTAAVWVIAVLGGLGTFLERLSFLSVADRAAAVPEEVKDALRMIPAAALAALVAPAVFRGGSVDGAVELLSPRMVAAALAIATMWKTRQILLTLLVGMGALLGLEALVGG